MNCFTVEISEPSGNILEIESCIDQVSNAVVIEQINSFSELTIGQCMAQLPSDINDIILGQIDNHLVAGTGISLLSTSGSLVIATTGLQPSGNYSLTGHQHIINDVSGLQTALDNKQPSGSYAQSIHSHIASDITDFNSSVSGLLPITDMLGGTNIFITNSGTVYTVSVSGQLGLTSEQVDDRVALLLSAGSGIVIDYNDEDNLLYISTSGLQPSGDYSVNGHQHLINDVSGLQTILDNKQPSGNYASLIHTHSSSDITNFSTSVSGLLPVINISAGSDISVVNNSGNYIVSVTGTFGLTGEEVDDRVNSLLKGGSYIDLNYEDNLDSLTINVTGLQPSGNYSFDGHSHTISDVSGLQNSLDNKQNLIINPITGIGSTNHIAYWTSSSGLSHDENQLYWDSSSNELGIGTNNPARNIDVVSSGGTSVGIKLNSMGTGGRSYSFFSTNNGSSLGGGRFGMYDDTAQVSRFVIDSGGNIGIGTNNPSYKLDIVGIGNFSQNLLVNTIPVSVSGHSHTSSDISDFNSSVSGLLPTIVNNGGNRILTSTGSSFGINAESNATFDGTNFNVTGVMNVDNLRLDANILSATNTNGNLIVQSNGTGALQRDSEGNSRGQYAVDWQNVRSTGTRVAGGNYSVIGGGSNNTTSGSYSVVAGGFGNSATSPYSVVGGGSNNQAAGLFFSTIAGGTENNSTGFWSSILGGQGNTSSNIATFVGGGQFNTAAGNYSVVCGGISNKASGAYGGILGGQSNNDNGFSKVFIIGSNITATQANTTFVNNLNVASSGDIDTLKINKLYHQNLAVATGVADSDLMMVIVDPTGSPSTEVIKGDILRSSLLQQPAQLQFRQGTNVERLLITPANGEPIWTTDTQKFYIGDGSTSGGNFVGPSPYDRGIGTQSIVALNTNCVASGNYTVVVGGENNIAEGFWAIIGGGRGNTASSICTIAGGSDNTAAGSYSAVCGGNNNKAIGIASFIGGGGGPEPIYSPNMASNMFSSICGGVDNTSSGYAAHIGGGYGNRATGNISCVLGGKSNTASASYSVVLGGSYNQASGSYSSVIGGDGTKSTKYGEIAHASGRFGNNGDAQHTILIARRTTTNNTANQILFLNGSNERLTLPAETTWTFEIKLSAYNDTDNAAAGWIFRGVIRRNASNGTALVGSLIEENWKETAMNNTGASVIADDTNEALQIRVTGLTGKNIRWVAVVDISQVSYGTP